MNLQELFHKVCRNTFDGLPVSEEMSLLRSAIQIDSILQDYDELDDMPTNYLSYIFVDYVHALACTNEYTDRERALVAGKAHMEMFLRVCDRYKIVSADTREKEDQKRMHRVASHHHLKKLKEMLSGACEMEREPLVHGLEHCANRAAEQIVKMEKERSFVQLYKAKKEEQRSQHETPGEDKNETPGEDHETVQERAFDEFKDENRRGSGNRYKRL
ncbi:MAG: uncharacterized protein A8A55_1413 [Amphiamblys sp. WSBS2006]|nr:MAG: uncharacterized protein A8A55_1413 [Amphiamblys sp. WSBS2006]